MEKRYQIFVSSTYSDLIPERQQVMHALLELDCIPSGMELFPASDDDQWTLIKRVIEECDYYAVIIAGRYGSIGPSGLSYTEMEYDYAIAKGIPTVAFIHDDPGKIPSEQCDLDSINREKLEAFRTKAKSKMAKFWRSPEDLGGKVSRSIAQLMKTHPAEGWVRARFASDSDELLKLRRENDELLARLAKLRTETPPETECLQQGTDKITLTLLSDDMTDGGPKSLQASPSWDEIFCVIGPLLIDEASEACMKSAIGKCYLAGMDSSEWYAVEVVQFQEIKIQFFALALIQKSEKKHVPSDTNTYWSLTPYGEAYLMRLMARRRDTPK